MTEIKWMKLTTDIFDNRKIKHLLRLPDGKNIMLGLTKKWQSAFLPAAFRSYVLTSSRQRGNGNERRNVS